MTQRELEVKINKVLSETYGVQKGTWADDIMVAYPDPEGIRITSGGVHNMLTLEQAEDFCNRLIALDGYGQYDVCQCLLKAKNLEF